MVSTSFANRVMVPLVNVAMYMRTVGVVMFGVGAAGAFAFTKMIGPAIEFQDQMAQVATMVDNTARHMDDFAEGITNLAMKFGESTESLSKGLYDILSATIAPAKALGVLEVSARAAAAGMTDTGTAADAVTTMLNAFSLSADRAEDVADLLFAIVRRGKTTFAELAPSIGRVAAAAALAGLPMEELGATISTITRAGIPTRIAMTSLNAVIRNFLTPTDEASAAAEQLGIALNTTTLRTKGLSGVIVELAGLQPELVGKMFPNVRALRAMAAVLQGATGYAYDYQVMLNRTGMMSEAFEKRTLTLRFALEQLKQTGLALVRMIGTALLPDLTELIQFLAKLAKGFLTLDKSTRLFLARATIIIPIIGLLGGAVLLLWKQIMGLGLYLTATMIPAMIAFAMTPIGAVATAAMLTLAVITGYKAFKQLRAVMKDVEGMMDEVRDASRGLGDRTKGLGENVTDLIANYKSLLEETDKLGPGTTELKEAGEMLQEAARRLGPEIMSLTSDYLEQKIALDELTESLKIHMELVILRTEYEEASRRIERYTEILEGMEDRLKDIEETAVLRPGFWKELQRFIEISAGAFGRLALEALGWRVEWTEGAMLMEEDQKDLIKLVEVQLKRTEERIEQLKLEREEISKKIKVGVEEVKAAKVLERAQRELRSLIMDSLIDERKAKEEEVLRTYERLKKAGVQAEKITIDGVEKSVSLEKWKNLRLMQINKKSQEEQAEFEMKMVGATAHRYIELLKERHDALQYFGSYTADMRRKIEKKIFDYAKDRQKAMIELEVEQETALSVVLGKVRELWAGLEGYITLKVANWTEFMQEREKEATEQYEKQAKKKEDIADAWFAYWRLIGRKTIEDEIAWLQKRLTTEEMTTLTRIKLLTRIHDLRKEQIKERKELLDAIFAYEMVTGEKTAADEIERMRETLRTEKMTLIERYKLMKEIVEKQNDLYEEQQEILDAFFKFQILTGEKTAEDEIKRLRLRLKAEELTEIESINLKIEIAEKEKDLVERRKAFADALFAYLRATGEKTLEDEIERQEMVVKFTKVSTLEKITAEKKLFDLREKKREQDEEAEKAGVKSYREIMHARTQAGIDWLKAAGHGREAEILEVQLALDKELDALGDQLAEKKEKFKDNEDLISTMTKAAEDRRYQLRAKAAQDIEAIHRKYTTEEMETALKRVDLEIKTTGEGYLKKIEYLKWWLSELRAGVGEEEGFRSDLAMAMENFGGDTLRVYDEMARAGHEVTKEMIGAFAELGDEEAEVLGQLHSAVEDYVNFVVAKAEDLPPAWWKTGREIFVNLKTWLQENYGEYEGFIKKVNEALKEGNRKYLDYVKATLDFELALRDLGKKEQLKILISFYDKRIKEVEAADEFDEESYRKLVLEKKELEDDLAEYIRTLSDKVFEYQRLIGDKTLVDAIVRLKDRLAVEKLTAEERVAILTSIYNLQKQLKKEEIVFADKVFEYQRLVGDKTLEDAIIRLKVLLEDEELTTTERIELATKLFNVRKKLADEQRELDDQVFEYRRLVEDATLEDAIARMKTLLENEELSIEERIKLATKLFNLEKGLEERRKKLAATRLEFQRKLGLKTLDDAIARQTELVALEKAGTVERLAAQMSLYDLITQSEKKLVDELVKRGRTNAEIQAEVEALWRAHCAALEMTAEETTIFIAEHWKQLIEDFNLVGETMEERWSMALERMRARIETWFMGIHPIFESLGEIVGGFVSQFSEGFSEALTIMISKTEKMEDVWQKMWQRLVAFAIQELLKLLAQKLVLFLISILGGGGPVSTAVPVHLTGGVGTGGAASMGAGGTVAEAEALISQYFQKLQKGGEVLVRAHVGEFMIPKWMTDFIKRTRSIPGELVEAIVTGRPPKKMQEGGEVQPGAPPISYAWTINFMPGSRFTEEDKVSTRAWFENEIWPLHRELQRRE